MKRVTSTRHRPTNDHLEILTCSKASCEYEMIPVTWPRRPTYSWWAISDDNRDRPVVAKKLNLMKSNSLHWIHRKVLFTWMDILFFLPAHKLFTKMLANRYAIHLCKLHLLYSIANTPLWNRFLEARISSDSNILTKVNGRYWCKAESCSVLVILSSLIFNHLYNEKTVGHFIPQFVILYTMTFDIESHVTWRLHRYAMTSHCKLLSGVVVVLIVLSVLTRYWPSW